jgi:hypothetical protein
MVLLNQSAILSIQVFARQEHKKEGKRTMNYYERQQYRKRSEATEQETLIQWCEWQQGKYHELELLYHIPNGGSRNKLEAANLKAGSESGRS